MTAQRSRPGRARRPRSVSHAAVMDPRIPSVGPAKPVCRGCALGVEDLGIERRHALIDNRCCSLPGLGLQREESYRPVRLSDSIQDLAE